jgi:hypothetical protein
MRVHFRFACNAAATLGRSIAAGALATQMLPTR